MNEDEVFVNRCINLHTLILCNRISEISDRVWVSVLITLLTSFILNSDDAKGALEQVIETLKKDVESE